MRGLISDLRGKKPETHSRRVIGKLTKLWKLNRTLSNHPRVKEETTRELRKYLQTDESKSPTDHTLRGTRNAALRGQLRAVNAYVCKEKWSRLNKLILCVKNYIRMKTLNPRWPREERSEDSSRKKWSREQKNSSRNQWNKELLFGTKTNNTMGRLFSRLTRKKINKTQLTKFRMRITEVQRTLPK